MAVYTIAAVRDNIRVKDGKRVFYLQSGDHLTPGARDWLLHDQVQIISGQRPSEQKPEHMTHLRTGELVEKVDPRIAFRGQLDLLEAEILLCGRSEAMTEILDAVRQIMRCDVLQQPLPERLLCGLDEKQLRLYSHYPEKYCGHPHFMPDFSDDPELLRLNRLRTVIRQTELAACRALPEREDIIQLLNRLSSLVWILMIRKKKETLDGRSSG